MNEEEIKRLVQVLEKLEMLEGDLPIKITDGLEELLKSRGHEVCNYHDTRKPGSGGHTGEVAHDA